MSGTVVVTVDSSSQAPEGMCAGSAQFELVESTSEALGEGIGVGRGAAAVQGVLGVDGVDGVDKIGTSSARSWVRQT